jgi:hypothetical protein
MKGGVLVAGAVAVPLAFVGLGCSTLLGIGEGVYVPPADAAVALEAASDASPAADSGLHCVFDDDASKFDLPPCTFGP